MAVNPLLQEMAGLAAAGRMALGGQGIPHPEGRDENCRDFAGVLAGQRSACRAARAAGSAHDATRHDHMEYEWGRLDTTAIELPERIRRAALAVRLGIAFEKRETARLCAHRGRIGCRLCPADRPGASGRRVGRSR